MTSPMPNPPLSDPQLFAQIQAGLGSESKFQRQRAERDRFILERFGWQEYRVKLGRWQKVDDKSALSYSKPGLPNLRWAWAQDLAAVLLHDPATGQPLYEYKIFWPENQDWVTTQTPSLWFAGDIRMYGLFSPGDGRRVAFGCRRDLPSSAFESVERIAEFTPKYAAKQYRHARGDEPWVVDHPQEPEAQAPPVTKRLFGKLRG
jgi:hypothetical protein